MDVLEEIGKFSAAEEFLDFFSVGYEERVVQVNRLHILKRFNQYLAQDALAKQSRGEVQWRACRDLLVRAYEDFVRSTPQVEKVFKVFQGAMGAQVRLERLAQTLPSEREAF